MVIAGNGEHISRLFLLLTYALIQDYSRCKMDNGPNEDVDLFITGSSITPEQISKIEAIYEENKDNMNQLSLIDEKS